MATPFVSRIIRPTLSFTFVLGCLGLVINVAFWQETEREGSETSVFSSVLHYIIKEETRLPMTRLPLQGTSMVEPHGTITTSMHGLVSYQVGHVSTIGTASKQISAGTAKVKKKSAPSEGAKNSSEEHNALSPSERWAADSWAVVKTWAAAPGARENACHQLKGISSKAREDQANVDKTIAARLLQAIGRQKNPLLDLDVTQELQFFGQECRLARWIRGLLVGGETTKLVVLGNSVTEGADVLMGDKGKTGEGCDCKRTELCEPHLRDPPFQKPFKCVNKRELLRGHRYYCCSWVLQFAAWVHRTFPKARIEHVLVSEAGLGSPKFGGSLERRLADAKVDLSPNDLVIVNLGIADTQLADAGVTLSSERLFGKLAESLSLAIVLIDVTGTKYISTYQRLSRKFKVPLFDYNALLVSLRENGLLRKKGSQIKSELEKIIQRRPHPPWIWHQLLADALVLALTAHMQNLTCSSAHWHDTMHSQCKSPAWVDADGTCAQETRKVTQRFSALETLGESVPERRTWAVAERSPWRLYEDREGKPGWIATRLNVSVGEKTGSTSPTLTFTFTNEIATQHKWFLHLDVTFMRTYQDAGWVDVGMCGIKVGRLDALWSVRASMPEAANFRLGFSEAKKSCGLSYQCSESCGSPQRNGRHDLNITFKHYSNLDALSDTERSARLPGAKFKILSVELCMKSK